MISNRAVTAFLFIAALVVVASPAAAQYMYLDANGNGVHDSGDRLAPNGTPTTVDVWVVTDHNRDGSSVVCPQDASAGMTLVSYVVNLEAGAGTVSYGGFNNHIGNVAFGEFNPGDGVSYKNGFGQNNYSPPGTYRLCTLTITGLAGTPRIDIVDQVPGSTSVNGGPAVTSFGSACFGNEFDNTYKLAGPQGGSDWTDVDGLDRFVIDEGTPVLAAIGNKTVNEGDCLTFTATATAPNGNPVTFSFTGQPPVGASITTAGQFNWCPTEAQGPGVYPITVTVTENGPRNLSDSETIQVTVNEVNVAPVLNPIGNKTAPLSSLLTFTATATDADVPANTRTFSLDPGAPAGATIGAATGVFSWTPNVSGTTPVTIRVTDNGTPPLSDSETILITTCLGCGITPPVLGAIGNKTVNELALLSFTATATDPDAGQTLTFSLGAGNPAGSAITAGGAFTWTPTEAQGPGVYPITVIVTDNGTPNLNDSETIQVTVNEVNLAPVLAAIGNKTVTAGNTLAFTATATDADLPANTLAFSLDPGAPVGAAITAGGNFTWTPTQSQAIGNYPITVRVTDNGVPSLSDAKTFAVSVPQGEIGAPVVTNPGNKTVNEGSCLNFTITATSAGGGTLTFALGAGAPSGASITPLGGQFTWCPTEAQGPGSYPITVNVSDGFLTGSTIFTITVLEVNQAPVLAPIGNKQACLLNPVTFTATATDADLPVNSLTFSIDPGSFPGATIDPVTGAFSWTAQAGGTFPFTIRVTDNGSPPLSDSETIAITVILSPPLPVLQQPADMTVTAGFTADQGLHATDLCANPLTFSKVSGPAFVTVTTIDQTTGNVHLAPTAADVGSYTVTVAADNVFLFDRKTLTVTVTPNQALPALQPVLDMTVDEGATASQTITGSDPDNEPLTFTKVSGPLWMTVQTLSPTTGLIVLSPDFTAGGTYQAMVRASNGTAYDQRTFTISVTNICRPPTANAGGPYSGTSGVAVQFNGGGSSDPDGDALTYAWSFGDGATGSGATPNHAYASQGTYVVGLTVTDVCSLTDDDATTATISTCLTAFFYATGNKAVMINLASGKPSECLQVEPVLGAFAIEDVDLASIVLRSLNTGSITEIHALGSKTSVGADRNGNGIDEITACFSKDDLRQLFSNLNATQTVQVTMEGDLVEGGRFCTTQGLSVKAAHGGGGSLAASISPNPLNPSAVLTFSTQERGAVLIQLFDVRGRLLRTLRDEADAAAGYHDVRIDGTTANGARLSSGIYYVRIRAGAEEERKTITILK